MTGPTVATRVTVGRRYVRAVEITRDVDDPDALDGYVITPSVRDAAVRICAGLSPTSTQRAFRVVGPYGAGKSAFAVFLAQLCREHGEGPAMELLAAATGGSVAIAPWRPAVVSGRRISFARELLSVVVRECSAGTTEVAEAAAQAAALLTRDDPLDVQEVVALLESAAAAVRQTSGEGLLLLVDEMGRFLEHAALGNEDPSIFQALAERAGGRPGADLAVVGFLHHRFADYVAGLGKWMEAEWTRSSERYEEVPFSSSSEQSLFMLARALTPVRRHTPAVRKRAAELYGEAVDRGLFAVAREDATDVSQTLYPLHPVAVATLVWAMRRFGQNERSLFSFLGSLEPSGFQRFAHATRYDAAHWYRAPHAFDYLAAMISGSPGSDRGRRWSLAFDAVALADGLPGRHQDVLKTVALAAVLEPVPGLVADNDTVAWSVGMDPAETDRILADLAERKLIYRRSHRQDYALWSSSSVDLSQWLEDAKLHARIPERLDDVESLWKLARPVVAHRHYHATGTLRTFEVRLWAGGQVAAREADGLILIAPTHPGEDMEAVLRQAAAAVADDPLALVCARAIHRDDLEWARELTLWRWIRENCDELRVDELARAEVYERIAAAERALTRVAALLSTVSDERAEAWWHAGKPVTMPKGLSAFLSDICDRVYDEAPILKNELINRRRLSAAGASARMRLLDRMLSSANRDQLGMDSAPPERTIFRSVFLTSGMHTPTSNGMFAFALPSLSDPCRWRPVWQRIEELIHTDEPIGFGVLMDELGRPPYGLRAGPALLVIVAIILASRLHVAVMERNSFVPELSVAHLMRLAKSPNRFAVKSLHEGAARKGVVRALAARLQVAGARSATLHALSEWLFTWYNALPVYALQTRTISPVALAVRTALRKASEPGLLFFHELPAACAALRDRGRIDIERYLDVLDDALREIGDAAPKLRMRAAAATQEAFGADDIATLRSRFQDDYPPHCLERLDDRLRNFVERAIDAQRTDDEWLDRIAGHVSGHRPESWDDDTLNQFAVEIRAMAGNLARWLALAGTRPGCGTDLQSVHVVGLNGQERVVVVRRDRPNPQLHSRLNAVREALGNEPNAVEVLGHLLAEYTEGHVGWQERKAVSST